MSDLPKCCNMCDTCWHEIREVLNDHDLEFNGYLAYPKKPEEGMFLFTHKTDDCGTTISLTVKTFQEICDNANLSITPFELGKAPDCLHFCSRKDDLSNCDSKTCPGVAVRKLVQLIKEQKK